MMMMIKQVIIIVKRRSKWWIYRRKKKRNRLISNEYDQILTLSLWSVYVWHGMFLTAGFSFGVRVRVSSLFPRQDMEINISIWKLMNVRQLQRWV